LKGTELAVELETAGCTKRAEFFRD